MSEEKTSEDQSRLSMLLDAANKGDPRAAEELLPLVYDELRRLARSRLRRLPPGQTLEATALVHDAYVRVVGKEDPGWNSRGHFFAAAAQAMRNILIDQARRKNAVKHGGGKKREVFGEDIAVGEDRKTTVLELDDAIRRLEKLDERKARIVTLRFFAGLTNEETAGVLGVSRATVEREWSFAKVWLYRELGG